MKAGMSRKQAKEWRGREGRERKGRTGRGGAGRGQCRRKTSGGMDPGGEEAALSHEEVKVDVAQAVELNKLLSPRAHWP
eukprot:411492-Hanusia_phi.AAC.1